MAISTVPATTATGGAPRRTMPTSHKVGACTTAASTSTCTLSTTRITSFRFVVCRTEAACGSRKATTRRLPLPQGGEGSVVDVDVAFDFHNAVDFHCL
jgi:hypothetical protein